MASKATEPDQDEQTALLQDSGATPRRPRHYGTGSRKESLKSGAPNNADVTTDAGHVDKSDKVRLRRRLGLLPAVVFIVVNMTGTGIFVTPTGVTAAVGSVGASLVMWAAAGVYNLVLALCYAELGTSLPAVAGGDYLYVERTLGACPAFVCLLVYVLLGPLASAIMARAFSEYLLPLFGLDCHVYLVVIIGVLINYTCAIINCVTVKWTSRLLSGLMLVKFLAFAMVIVLGFIQIGAGNTSNFEDAFAGSSRSPAMIAAGVIPGFVSYQGWDLVCSLAEEMNNPARDLPLSLVIAVSLTIAIYVTMNVAYFTVLSPAEFIMSNAVGRVFAEKVIPGAAWVIPVIVALSAVATTLGVYLGCPRYVYAGARDGQLPQSLGMLSMKYYTPVPAIMLQLVLALFFSSATFFNLQGLFLIMGVNLQLKIGLTLVGLLVLKWRMPGLRGSVTVPSPVVVFCILLIVAITLLVVYQDPYSGGIGTAFFVAGIPLYLLGQLLKRSSLVLRGSTAFTIFLQQLLLVVPPEDVEEDLKDK